MLSTDDVRNFERDGFLIVRGAIDRATLAELQRVTDALIDRTRTLTEGDEHFELEAGHSAATPRLRRIAHPVALDEVYWRVASSPRLVGAMTALFGPHIKFHHSKLNTKVGGGGAKIGWHQDFAFFPHTNYDLAACGIALDPSTLANGCLLVVPGSHRGPLLNHRRADGSFSGAITDGEFSSQAVPVELQPGDMSIHHAMLIHGSAQNDSTLPRRLLIYQYAACDAIALDYRAPANRYSQHVLAGEAAREARLAGPVTLPLRGEIKKNSSLFKLQQAAAMT
jgi:hypothetical protein